MVPMTTPSVVATAMWEWQADAPALASKLRHAVIAKWYHIYK
jgi:hypothetical protein